jgi:FkbM family methyltransferase
MTDHPVQIPALNLTGTDPAVPGWHRETSPPQALLPDGEDLTIFVIGAYSGTVAGMLLEQHPAAKHYLFEPQDWACVTLREKFGQFPNVKVCQEGLGDRSGVFHMGSYQTYDCSFMRGPTPYTGKTVGARLIEFEEFVRREGIRSIDYATLNIEAYEYVLLAHMSKIGWLEKCQMLGISWHQAPGNYTWLDEPAASYAEVQELLKETHRLVLSIDNWQTWERLDV